MIRVYVATIVSGVIASSTGASTTLVVGILGGLGGLGVLVNFFLAPRQGRSIAVSASEAAVRAVNEALASLQNQLSAARAELDRTKAQLDEVQQRMIEVQKEAASAKEEAAKQLQAAQWKAADERKLLNEKIVNLVGRIRELERRVEEEKRGVDKSAYRGPERRVEDTGRTDGPDRRQ